MNINLYFTREEKLILDKSQNTMKLLKEKKFHHDVGTSINFLNKIWKVLTIKEKTEKIRPP